MVNATEMAKPFGKTTKDWLRTNQSKEFIASLSAVRQISPTEFIEILESETDAKERNSVVIQTRGKSGGTWAHPYLFIKWG